LIKNNHLDKLFECGLKFHQLGDLINAEKIYLEVLKIDDKHHDSIHYLGVLAYQQKRFEDAIDLIEHSIQLNSRNAAAYTNRGNVLKDVNRLTEAADSYKKALSINPNSSEAFANLGIIFKEMNQIEMALSSYEMALDINPNYSQAYFNKGNALKEIKLIDEALLFYEKAITLNPNYQEAIFNKAISLLLKEEIVIGFKDYESRWRLEDFISGKKVTTKPLWLGDKSLFNKTILIHSEQGLGDTLQFVRYLPFFLSLGASVFFEVEEKLIKILSPTYSSICTFIPKGSKLPDFDFHCPLLSLPLAFKTNLDTIPSSLSYLSFEEESIDKWKSRITSIGFKIGINWQGSYTKIDLGRSFPLSLFSEISKISEVRLISLQKGFGVEQLHNLPEGMMVETLGDDFDAGPDAFIDTASVMKCLDLVITSDTSIAHLAGALGVPTWIALKYVPDWRWLLDRPDSPWYPTMRLFRQKERGNWMTVFDEMKDELLQIVAK